jgi:hypothetical protein
MANEDLERWLHAQIAVIRARQEPFGCYCPIPGCPPAELAMFVKEVRRLFDAELPAEYLTFLSVQNGGGEWAGLYGTATREFESPGGSAAVSGFIEKNQMLQRPPATFGKQLAYGETDMDYIVHDSATGRFQLRGKIGGDVYDELPDIVTVIKYAMS